MMKKLLFTMAGLLLATTAFAQEEERAPITGTSTAATTQNNFSPEDLFDLEFSYDIGVTGAVGANSQAGVAFINDQFWVSTWNTDQITILDNAGGFVETVFITGLAGTRSFTSDGTRLWAGTAGTQIFEIDPVTRTIINTINITTSSSASARMCTYDETLDGGNGGFWIGNFSSDIASVDMSGNELSVIPLATHGTAMYGGAIDNVSDGGPYLWISDQTAAGGQHLLTQLDVATGTPTGIVYDFAPDAPAGTTGIAGGLFISPAGGAAAETTLVSVCQCTPSNILFGVELSDNLGVNENQLSNFSMYPVPANGNTLTISTATGGDLGVVVYDLVGKQVINTTVANNTLDISSLSRGVYIVQVAQNGTTAQKKLVVQ